MPIFKYYNPYRRPNFYNYYQPTHGTIYTPISHPDCTPALQSKSEASFQPEETPLQNRSKPKSDDNVWLDLFGIKLYFDDVLILSLLFFLYKEEVKDEGLFLALVLLLIS